MFKTLKDEWIKDKQQKDKLDKYFDKDTDTSRDNPRVVCTCGVKVPADMMVDVRDVPTNLKYLDCPDFICDGCFSRLIFAGVTTNAEIASYLTDDVDEVIQLNDRDQFFGSTKDPKQKKVKVGKV